MTRTPTSENRATYSRTVTMLIGVISLIVLLQAAWAGMFIREGKDNNSKWVSVHARGADLAILLSIVALVLVFLKLRERRDLLMGTAAMTVLLIVEAYLGGIIGDNPAIEVIHFPLGMALMGLAVWLPLRVRADRTR
jgi:heme A synthase